MDVQLILLIFVFSLGIAIRVLVSMQTPGQAVHKKPRHLLRVPTAMKQDEIFAVVQKYAPQADLAVAEVNAAEGRIILQQDDQILHRGFWLPIYITAHSSGLTVVEVGMQPLAPLAGIPDHILRKTAKQLETLLN